MDDLIAPSQLAGRIHALGLSATAFAKRAQLHHVTLMRVMNGGNCSIDTLRAISRALLAEEARLLAHLQSLHPERTAA